ncbi:MAG: sulfotransferase [Inquilinus sp.]|nr:sulfotransferase [Inquilinus sp.]
MGAPAAGVSPSRVDGASPLPRDHHDLAPANHDDFSPIFIVGFPRSGTTLLATVLSRHSRIAVTPETLFMEQVFDDATDPAVMLARVAGSRRCRDLGLDADVVAANFTARPPTYCWLFRVLLETYAADAGKDFVAEKSPLHLLHVPTLAQWYPRARFLLLVRDGRDCVLSMLKVPWAHNSVLRHSAEWRRRMGKARRLYDSHRQTIHIVRYEELLLAPERELRNAMAFLGLAFERIQLSPSTASSAVPGWEKAWKSKAYDVPDASRVAAWKREADPATLLAMESVMRDELAAWGYEVIDRRLDPAKALAGSIFASDSFKKIQKAFRRLRAATW